MSKVSLGPATCAAMFGAAVMAGPARAAVEIGSPITFPGKLGRCPDHPYCVSVQDELPGAHTRVPVLTATDGSAVTTGVIVRVRIKGVGSFGVAPVRYVSDDVVVQRQPAVRQFIAPDRPDVETRSFSAAIGIETGDAVALSFDRDSWIYSRELIGARVDFWREALTPGVPFRADQRDEPWEDGWNVVIEADRDNDGFGDETQDLCPTSSTTRAACPAAPTPAPPTSQPSPGLDVIAPIIGSATVRRARLRLSLSESAQVGARLQRRRGRGYTTIVAIGSYLARGRRSLRLFERTPRRGRYRVVITATDSAGNRSRRVNVRFRIAR